jgi:hypothetical protein
MNTLILKWEDQYVKCKYEPIIGRLLTIPQIPNQIWITMKKNIEINFLSNFKNLNLHGASRAKPFAN